MHRCISSVAYGKLAWMYRKLNQRNNNLDEYSAFHETQGHFTQVRGDKGKENSRKSQTD